MPWTLWYTDLFDREMPPQREASGTALRAGLRTLWEKTLDESITADGQRSFSSFSLSLGGGQAWVDTFRTAELVKLRRWAAADPAILDAVADAHERLIGEHRATPRARTGGEEAAAVLDAVGAVTDAAELPRALAAARVTAR